MADPVAWEPTMKSPYVGMCVWPVPENKENCFAHIYPYMSSTLPLTKHMENVTITGPVNFDFPAYYLYEKLLTSFITYSVPRKAQKYFLFNFVSFSTGMF